MTKPTTPEALPREVRDFLERVDHWSAFEVARNRFEAITIICKRKRLVFKFVRATRALVKALDQEIATLKMVARKKIPAPKVIRRVLLKKFVLVIYAYVEGEVDAKKVTASRVRALARAHRKLHEAYAPVLPSVKTAWHSGRVLKPIFAKRNSREFSARQIDFAKETQQSLVLHEKQKQSRSLIHSDSHFSNVVFRRGVAFLIDYAEAGIASIYFEIGVVVHALLYQPARLRVELIVAYLQEYFQRSHFEPEELHPIELHVRLRFIEAATWHLLESAEDQEKNRIENQKWIAECFRKGEAFRLKTYLK